MSDEGLIARRKVGTSWRDAIAARIAERGAPDTCLAAFDAFVAAGRPEAEAAYRVLAAHDLLWRRAAPPDPPGGMGQAGTVPAL